MKKIAQITALAALAISSTSFAKDIADIEVGSTVCYDGLGTNDVIGTVVSKNASSKKVDLKLEDGSVKTFKAKKIKSRLYCGAKAKAQSYAYDKAKEMGTDKAKEAAKNFVFNRGDE